MSTSRQKVAAVAFSASAVAGFASVCYGPALADVYFAERALAKETSALAAMTTSRDNHAKNLARLERESRNIARAVEQAKRELDECENDAERCREELEKWTKELKSSTKRVHPSHPPETVMKERAEIEERTNRERQRVDEHDEKWTKQKEKVRILRKTAEACMDRLVRGDTEKKKKKKTAKT